MFKNNNGDLGLSLYGLTDIKSLAVAKKNISDYNNYINSLSNPTKSAHFLNSLNGASDTFKEYAKNIKGTNASLGGYIKYLVSTNVKTKALEIGTKALNMALSMLAMWAISATFSAISTSIQEAKQAQEEFRRSQIEAGKTADETNDKLQEYIATYHELAKSGGSADQLKDLQQQIADLVGVQADNLDLVNGKLDDELGKLRQITKCLLMLLIVLTRSKKWRIFSELKKVLWFQDFYSQIKKVD